MTINKIRKPGLEAVIKVNGFHDARRWLATMTRDRVLRCCSCDNPAVRIFWVDRAEWYPECAEHGTYRDQWVGHTSWNPQVFSVAVLDSATAWHEALPEDERQHVTLQVYDRFDYYSLLPEWGEPGCEPEEVILKDFGAASLKALIYTLTDGTFAYKIRRERPGWSYTDVLVPNFDSREQALAAARTEANR